MIDKDYYISKLEAVIAQQSEQNTADTLDEWIYFLKNSEIPQNYTAKGLKESAEKLQIDKLLETDKKNIKDLNLSVFILILPLNY